MAKVSIHSSDPHFMGVVFIAVGTLLVFAAISVWKKRRQIIDLGNIDISSAPQGLVELSGFAWAQNIIQNLDDRFCAYFYWQLQKEVRRGKKTSWNTIASGDFPGGFIMKDKSGAAWVSSEKTRFDIKGKYYPWGVLNETQKKRVLEWMGAKVSDVNFSWGRYRVHVKDIKLGSPVLAQGNFSTYKKLNFKILPGIQSFTERYEKLQNNALYATQMMDANSDGRIDEQEYSLAHSLAAESMQRKVANGSSINSFEEIDIIGSLEASPETPLVVADTHQKYYLERLQNKFYVAMGIGLLFFCVGIAMTTDLI